MTNLVMPGQVWIDSDGAAVLILEEEKALVLESYYVLDMEDCYLITRAEHLEGAIQGSFKRAAEEQKKYWNQI